MFRTTKRKKWLYSPKYETEPEAKIGNVDFFITIPSNLQIFEEKLISGSWFLGNEDNQIF